MGVRSELGRDVPQEPDDVGINWTTGTAESGVEVAEHHHGGLIEVKDLLKRGSRRTRRLAPLLASPRQTMCP